jgi:purine-binding chemotaxis protein CheW
VLEALDAQDSAATSAARLKAAFDATFAAPIEESRAESIDLLALRLAGDPFAVRLRETAGLFADHKITAVPSPLPELRGLAGVRGTLLPVYDLAALLGYPLTERPRWLLAARGAPVCFAFDVFDGQLRVDAAELVTHEGSSTGRASEVVRAAAFSGPVIHLDSLIAALVKRAPRSASQEEA